MDDTLTLDLDDVADLIDDDEDDADPNEDLIGYEFDSTLGKQARWRVLQTDVVCGAGYVALRIVNEFGELDERAEAFRIAPAAVVRRRKEIEAASC